MDATPDKIADDIPLTLHSPVEALGIMATVALIFALDWAQPFLIILLLGILYAYTLNPLVVWSESRCRASWVLAVAMLARDLHDRVWRLYAAWAGTENTVQLPEPTEGGAGESGVRGMHMWDSTKLSKSHLGRMAYSVPKWQRHWLDGVIHGKTARNIRNKHALIFRDDLFRSW